MANEMRIAVLGTGRMGSPIARRLLDAGFDVTVWNRTAARAQPLVAAGARLADSPAAAGASTDVILTMLTDGEAVQAAMSGPDGALSRAAKGTVWIQMATVGVDWTSRLDQLSEGTGVVFVDAPVSGSDVPAQQGQLVILASGPDSVRATLEPLFAAIGRKTIWLGPAGNGSRFKMVLNNWLAAEVEGVAESIALTESLGLDPRLFVETLTESPLGSPYAVAKSAAMLDQAFQPGFALRLAFKDVGLAIAAAREHGLELPVTEAIAQRWSQAMADGHGDDDVASVITTAISSTRLATPQPSAMPVP